MFTLSELWSVSERQGRYKLLKPWWEVFMDYLVILMLMVSILAGTLLLSRDGVVCVPVHSSSSNFNTSSGSTRESEAHAPPSGSTRVSEAPAPLSGSTRESEAHAPPSGSTRVSEAPAPLSGSTRVSEAPAPPSGSTRVSEAPAPPSRTTRESEAPAPPPGTTTRVSEAPAPPSGTTTRVSEAPAPPSGSTRESEAPAPPSGSTNRESEAPAPPSGSTRESEAPASLSASTRESEAPAPPSRTTRVSEAPARGRRTSLDFQQYVYISQVCYHEALPWFSRFLPYVTLLQSLLLLASGCFWFHFPLTSARIEHFLTILAKCSESPWTSRALSRTAKLDSTQRPQEEEQEQVMKPPPTSITRQSSLDSGTDSPLLVRTGSTSTTTNAQPSPCPSSLSRCSTVSFLPLPESTPSSKSAPVVPQSSRPGPSLDRSDGEQARALFERVRRFRAHCENSDIIYKVYTVQTVFKVMKMVVIVSYTAPLLSSISFNHTCQPHSHGLTGYQSFQCSHSLASVLRKLMQAYVGLVSLYGLLGIYTLFWIFHKSLRQYSFQQLREVGSMLDAPDLSNDLAFLLHMTDQYDPLLAQRLSVFLSPVSETRLMEESLERRWSPTRLRSMISSDQQGRSLLQLVALPRLPAALFTLSQLEVLKLELIREAKLTAQISNMTALRELHLYHCSATVEPGALVVLQERLESLHLTFTQAAEIPGWVYSLRGLQELHLTGRLANEGSVGRGWALGSLRHLRHLRVLSLRGMVQRIPGELSEAAGSLVRLEIHNEGTRLLVLTGLRRLLGLAELELQGCQLERLPSALLALTGLRSLDLQHNCLRTLEELLGLQHLRRLSSLRLAHNRVLVLPSSVGVLRALELLDLAHNQLQTLPPALFTLHRLRRLLLAGNLLEELSQEVGGLTLLIELDLSGNRLESLPKELFTKCLELRTLNVANNSLGSLQPGLGSLSLLSQLDLQGNNLEELPEELGFCSGLRGGGLLVESWLLHTLPHHIRDFLQQPRSPSRASSSEANSQPDSDIFPAYPTTHWSFFSATESRI